MRTLPLVILAALALIGCQSREAQWQKAYNEKRAWALQNGLEPARQPAYQAPPRKPFVPKFQPGTDMMGIVPPTVVFNEAPIAPPQPSAPQPIIFTGGGSGTTMASRVGNTTVVSQFGGPNRGTTMATQLGDTTIVSQFGGYRAPIGGYRPYYGAPVGGPYGY